jgi:asparagine synthase (glutamine-hydrolysing)
VAVCGLAGVLLSERKSIPISDIVDNMAATLKHRGPDSSGNWVDTTQGIGLSHRRLSIVDLSEHGRQPMVSQSERYVLAYNGEVYNHLEVRIRLEKETGPIKWQGYSDTETIVEAIAHWGVGKTLEELVGMFAMALWDRQDGELTLARDRIGEKPLYFGILQGTLIFGSELKALLKVPQFTFAVNPQAVASFMRVGYVPEPHSIYESVSKVPAGTFMTFSKDDVARNFVPPPNTYWSFVDVAQKGLDAQPEKIDLADAVDSLESLLSRSIEGQLMGDVPVGAFLSGGIDSSTVVALMQKLSTTPVKTFSIGFSETGFDESQYAEAVARHLGTDHYSMTVSAKDAQTVIPKLAQIYDEPFADSSQIPTYLVSKLARENVTVSLSGDAGDELFAGYNRYSSGARRWGAVSRVPQALRKVISGTISKTSPEFLNAALSPILGRLSSSLGTQPGDKLHKAARVLSASTDRELYDGLNSTGSPETVLLMPLELEGPYSNAWPIEGNLTHQMMGLDTLGYLPGDILVKVDRASMSHSLESRMPFLDHRVVEFAWSLPLEMKLNNRESKIVLRRVLEKHVPRALFERPKMGFGIPLAEWLRGPLRQWANDLLTEKSLNSSGFFNVASVRNQWTDHLNLSRNYQYSLWNILMFQAWHQSSIGESPSCEHS